MHFFLAKSDGFKWYGYIHFKTYFTIEKYQCHCQAVPLLSIEKYQCQAGLTHTTSI